ncbi:polysulfide reductase NrfD [Bacteroidales bacterium AH-315-N07]|nr:polysulfide reductase NrfD [Bacteroidales bacterium AH-315-N07]
MSVSSPIRSPLITGDKTYHQITEDICGPVEGKPSMLWYIAITITSLTLGWGLICMGITIWFGIGTFGLNKTVGWGWCITNFVWWIGIGHAGTLISAILLLFRQRWRTGIARSAEAMTIFAVICASLFPAIHMGRIWLAFYPFPYPNTRGPIWVNFNSALFWDVCAISTYFTISLIFWYIGLIPDIATVRDRAKTKIRQAIYGILSFGWNGSARHWHRHEIVCLHLAGIATPLVLSVHSVVSFDFATSVIPGWHTTIFPPYFVAGAIFSGFAMVLTLMIIARKTMRLENYITVEHIELMNKIILLTGSIVGIAYLTEFFVAWYSGNEYELYAFVNRATGPYWWAYWTMMTCNVISPQLFWIKKLRRSVLFTFLLSFVINIGMWFERFVIFVTSLHRDYLPSSWAMYSPSFVEIGIFLGTLGLFFTAFLLFAKFMPVVAIAEVKHNLKLTGSQFIKNGLSENGAELSTKETNTIN